MDPEPRRVRGTASLSCQAPGGTMAAAASGPPRRCRGSKPHTGTRPSHRSPPCRPPWLWGSDTGAGALWGRPIHAGRGRDSARGLADWPVGLDAGRGQPGAGQPCLCSAPRGEVGCRSGPAVPGPGGQGQLPPPTPSGLCHSGWHPGPPEPSCSLPQRDSAGAAPGKCVSHHLCGVGANTNNGQRLAGATAST